jgi:hypothetical protein
LHLLLLLPEPLSHHTVQAAEGCQIPD